jgi:Fe-S-cluster containining protein
MVKTAWFKCVKCGDNCSCIIIRRYRSGTKLIDALATPCPSGENMMAYFEAFTPTMKIGLQ